MAMRLLIGLCISERGDSQLSNYICIGFKNISIHFPVVIAAALSAAHAFLANSISEVLLQTGLLFVDFELDIYTAICDIPFPVLALSSPQPFSMPFIRLPSTMSE